MNTLDEQMEKRVRGAWIHFWPTEEAPLANGSEFGARCVSAVGRGLERRKMSAAAQEIGFRAMPLDSYLGEVARKARIALPEWLESLASKATGVWVEAARAIALPNEEAALMIRAMFARSRLAVSAVRFRQTATTAPSNGWSRPDMSAEDYRRMLMEEERHYDPAQRQTLKALLAAWADD